MGSVTETESTVQTHRLDAVWFASLSKTDKKQCYNITFVARIMKDVVICVTDHEKKLSASVPTNAHKNHQLIFTHETFGSTLCENALICQGLSTGPLLPKTAFDGTLEGRKNDRKRKLKHIKKNLIERYARTDLMLLESHTTMLIFLAWIQGAINGT